VPLIEPSATFVRAHTYEIPDVGQVETHAGVAVKICMPPGDTEGAAGLSATEVRTLVTEVVTVITALLSSVTSFNVALTKMPPVTVMSPAMKTTEVPVPVIEPRVGFVRVHE
jgi:hypothetical protein